jgi:RNA polymerase sigma-70 factor, ECF subfamily
MTAAVPAWWQSFVDGELGGFGSMIEAYERRVFAVAVATVIDRSLAEDVVQETFLAAYARRADVRDPAALGRWLTTIARNRGRDLLRAHRREALTDVGDVEMADGASPSDDAEAAALRSELCRALSRVPASMREALVLYYAHDCSAEHVARELGLSEAATMQRLSRGRKLMRHYAAALEDYVRPRKAIGAAIVALLALRKTDAQASPPRGTRSTSKLFVVGATSIVLGVGATLADGRSARALPAASHAEIATPADIEHVAVIAHDVAASPQPATTAPPTREPDDRIAPRWRIARVEPAVAVTADTTLGATAHVDVTVRVPVPRDEACACPVTPPRARRWEPANAFIENAALPPPGDVSFEMLGLEWLARVGIGRNLAAHVAFAPIDTRMGDHRNANPAFGGGLKIGGPITDRLSLAVVGEAAREVNLKTLSTGTAWLGRAYASLTRGDARNNITASAGVVGYDNRSDRYVVPMLALGTQIGWDDRLGFVVESQWFLRPISTLSRTTTFAVRFRHEQPDASLLGMRRVRIDVGTVLVDTTDDDIAMAPWLQVGFGW